MNRTANKQSGFSIIEIVLVVLVIGALAAIGLLVYLQHTTTKPTVATNSQQKSTTVTHPPTDPYQGWQTYCDSTVKACIKYPSDWVASQYGGLENPACTEYASLTGPTSKDRGSSPAYIVSIDDLSTPVSDLKILGTVVDNKPGYSIYNASYISQNNIHVGGTQEIASANYRFTGKTGDAGLVGTPCANGYAAITTSDQAKAWFNSTEGKTVLKVVQSLYYQ